MDGRHHGLKIKIFNLIPFLYIWLHLQSIPYRMEMYTEFNLATWLRLVKLINIVCPMSSYHNCFLLWSEQMSYFAVECFWTIRESYFSCKYEIWTQSTLFRFLSCKILLLWCCNYNHVYLWFKSLCRWSLVLWYSLFQLYIAFRHVMSCVFVARERDY